jgi:hypothetical protein
MKNRKGLKTKRRRKNRKQTRMQKKKGQNTPKTFKRHVKL